LRLSIFRAFAEKKERHKVVIEVVESQASVREVTSTQPGTAAKSRTNCQSSATAQDTGGGTAIANGTTNCNTTTTPGRPPTTTVTSIPQIHVQAMMPNKTHVTLWCQQGLRRCSNLLAGSYNAEVDGNSIWMDVPDLGGKVHRTKYTFIGGW
jgi:hypothetical protein